VTWRNRLQMCSDRSLRMTSNPVLVVGSGRSGTTFVGKIFDSDPCVVFRHEPEVHVRDGGIPYLPRDNELACLAENCRIYFDKLTKVRAPDSAATFPVFRKAYRSSLGNAITPAGLLAVRLLGKLAGVMYAPDPLTPAWLCEAHSSGARVVVKSVAALGRIPLVSAALPEWYLVHVVRHPCAVISSRIEGIRRGSMTNHTYLRSLYDAGLLYWLKRTLAEIERSSFIEKAAMQWAALNNRAATGGRNNPRYQLVQYEILCEEPVGSVRKLFESVAMKFGKQTAEFIGSLQKIKSSNRSYFDVKRNPKESILKWESRLSNSEIRDVEKIVTLVPIGRLYFG